MDLKGKKVLFILSSRNFRDEEFLEPKKILENLGVNITIVNETGRESVGMLGTRVEPNLNLDKVIVNDYDAIIFVGGSGSTVYWNNQKAMNIIKEAKIKGKVVAAICMATGTLAKAGILKGKEATGWDDAEEVIVQNGGKYTAEDIVINGRVITAYGPKQANKFGLEIARLLTKGNLED